MKKSDDMLEIEAKVFEMLTSGRVTPKFLQDIINDGFDVNATFGEGETLLHVAIILYREDLIEVLLKNNANIEALTDNGHSPLLVSIAFGGLLTELLLEKGADPNAKLHYATGDEDMTVLMFVAGAEKVTYSNTAMIEMLLKFEASVSTKSKAGKTVLDIAREVQATEIIELLEPILKKEQDQILKQKQAQQAIRNRQKISDHVSGHGTPKPRRRPKP